MKAFGKLTLIFIVVLGLSLLVDANSAFSQEEMSMDEYRAQLAEWKNREDNANAAIATLEGEIEALKAEIAQCDADIATCWDEIYALLETDEASVEEYRAALKDLSNEVDGLAALAPEELFKKKGEIAGIEEKIAENKTSKIYALTEMQDLVAAIEGKIAQLKDKMPKAVYEDYVVIRGDYLWKISGKEDIYGDPYQWMRIYSCNKDLIKDPDLIYPDWILKIQRGVGPDQYLVLKGDFLYKIAQNPDILNDPAAWTKIYETNKDIIGEDPSLIYPYTVLVIPKD